jgi:hypothetical protein
MTERFFVEAPESIRHLWDVSLRQKKLQRRYVSRYARLPGIAVIDPLGDPVEASASQHKPQCGWHPISWRACYQF